MQKVVLHRSKHKKAIFAGLAILGLAGLLFVGVKSIREQINEKAHYSLYYNHEDLSKEYWDTVKTEFDSCVKTHDTAGLQFLSLQLDVRLKMEDFRIKFNQAEHAELSTYLPTIITALATLIVGAFGFFQIKRGDEKNSQQSAQS